MFCNFVAKATDVRTCCCFFILAEGCEYVSSGASRSPHLMLSALEVQHQATVEAVGEPCAAALLPVRGALGTLAV